MRSGSSPRRVRRGGRRGACAGRRGRLGCCSGAAPARCPDPPRRFSRSISAAITVSRWTAPSWSSRASQARASARARALPADAERPFNADASAAITGRESPRRNRYPPSSTTLSIPRLLVIVTASTLGLGHSSRISCTTQMGRERRVVRAFTPGWLAHGGRLSQHLADGPHTSPCGYARVGRDEGGASPCEAG